MMGGVAYDPELDDPSDKPAEEEPYKVEYSGQLLLGDRDNQKWLELLAQNLLKSLLKL